MPIGLEGLVPSTMLIQNERNVYSIGLHMLFRHVVWYDHLGTMEAQTFSKSWTASPVVNDDDFVQCPPRRCGYVFGVMADSAAVQRAQDVPSEAVGHARQAAAVVTSSARNMAGVAGAMPKTLSMHHTIPVPIYKWQV